MVPAYFTLISIPLGLIGTFYYIRDMHRGTTVPNRVSFFLWALAPMIGSAIAFAHGEGYLVVPIFMAGFNPLIIFLFSFAKKVGYWKLVPFDYVCGLFSLIALILWLGVDAPLLAFIFSILADLFAGIPTIIKSWKSPKSESGFLYIISSIGNVVALFTITSWVFISYGFQTYLILANSAILLGIYRNRLFKKVSI